MTIISTAHSIATFANAAYTQAMKVKFNKTVVLSRIGIYGNGSVATSVTAGVRVWDINNTRIGQSANATVSVSSTGPTWITLNSPVTLNANTVYYIGSYMSTSCSYVGSGKVSHDEPAVDGIVLTNMIDEEGGVGGTRYLTGDADPIATGTQNIGYEFAYAVDVTLAATQPAPTTTNPVVVTSGNGSNTSAADTTFSNERKVDRTSNGVLWVARGNNTSGTTENVDLYYSTDNGQNWTLSSWVVGTNSSTNSTVTSSFFIDIDDYAHIVYKDKTNGYIYYRRGTPNANRTSWSWSAATAVVTSSYYDYPDVVAHREGSGWQVHVIFTQATTVSYSNKVYYSSSAISSAGAVGSFSSFVSIDSSKTANAKPGYPSVDFHHTGDGKTVSGGLPHLYVAWSAGSTGSGYGTRFKKATYSSGSWTWGTEREIDNTVYISRVSEWINCLFDGTRVMIVAFVYALSGNYYVIGQRDEADTTTTEPVYLAPSGSEGAYYGGATYDQDGNIYIFGQGNLTNKGSYRKWTRSTGSMGAEVSIGAYTNGGSVKRGYSGNRLENVYVTGSANPYSVNYNYVALNTAPTVTINNPGTIDPRVSNRFTWNYSDAESNPQVQYEIDYRVSGGTTWTTTTNASANAYHDFAANTFTDETNYEWQVRVNDGIVWSTFASGTFRSDSWTYLTEVSSANHSGSFDTTSLNAGTYELEVRAYDGYDYSSWSAASQFSVVTTNIYYFDGTSWVAKTKKYFDGTTWKEVPPTQLL